NRLRCPKGWHRLGGTCYYFSSNITATVQTANQTCSDLYIRSRLMKLRTAVELVNSVHLLKKYNLSALLVDINTQLIHGKKTAELLIKDNNDTYELFTKAERKYRSFTEKVFYELRTAGFKREEDDLEVNNLPVVEEKVVEEKDEVDTKWKTCDILVWNTSTTNNSELTTFILRIAEIEEEEDRKIVCSLSNNLEESATYHFVCEHVLDFCFANLLCGKHGSCTNTLADFKCTCSFLYGGDRCDRFSAQGKQIISLAVVIVLVYLLIRTTVWDFGKFLRSTASNRFTTAAVFGILAFEVLKIFEELLFSTSDVDQGVIFKVLQQIGLAILVGCRYYPILASLQLSSATCRCFAFLYVLADIAYTIYREGSCMGLISLPKKFSVLDEATLRLELGTWFIIYGVFKNIPHYLFLSYIGAELSVRFIYESICRCRTRNADKPVMLGSKYVDEYTFSTEYAKKLFKRQPDEKTRQAQLEFQRRLPSPPAAVAAVTEAVEAAEADEAVVSKLAAFASTVTATIVDESIRYYVDLKNYIYRWDEDFHFTAMILYHSFLGRPLDKHAFCYQLYDDIKKRPPPPNEEEVSKSMRLRKKRIRTRWCLAYIIIKNCRLFDLRKQVHIRLARLCSYSGGDTFIPAQSSSPVQRRRRRSSDTTTHGESPNEVLHPVENEDAVSSQSIQTSSLSRAESYIQRQALIAQINNTTTTITTQRVSPYHLIISVSPDETLPLLESSV
ncbi:unnamed protein product, partial [Didymodactylos carnosus]